MGRLSKADEEAREALAMKHAEEGIWYVKSKMYEKAIHFFERAAQMQPKEVKWRLMVTSCYRRMGNYQRALELYEKVHGEHPDNAECLRYLVTICKDLGQPHDHYQAKLSRLGLPTTRLEEKPQIVAATLEEISRTVSEVLEQLKNKKNYLAPKIKELRALRLRCQEKEAQWEDHKRKHDTLMHQRHQERQAGVL